MKSECCHYVVTHLFQRGKGLGESCLIPPGQNTNKTGYRKPLSKIGLQRVKSKDIRSDAKFQGLLKPTISEVQAAPNVHLPTPKRKRNEPDILLVGVQPCCVRGAVVGTQAGPDLFKSHYKYVIQNDHLARTSISCSFSHIGETQGARQGYAKCVVFYVSPYFLSSRVQCTSSPSGAFCVSWAPVTEYHVLPLPGLL